MLNLPIKELLSRLEATPDGLTSEDAVARLKKYGTNEFPRPRGVPAWLAYLRLFVQPLVVVLIAAGILSAFFGESRGAIIIGIMVLLSVTLQFFQEYRSEQTAQKLARQVAITATVVRDGAVTEMPMRELVPGDVIRLSVGDIVPADARVLYSRDFFVDQAALTGESFPVEKMPCDKPGRRLALPDMNHAVFFGTNVVSGTATALVVGTNGQTEFGRMAKSLSVERPETEFQRGIRKFTSFLIKVIAVLVVLIFALNAGLHRGVLQSLLFAVAVSVGITPELLPMIITINLSAGAAAMARRKVIVKRLHSIQNLGSMDVLCTDKTGTLTEGKLVLHSHIDVNGQTCEQTFRLARLNSVFQASLRNPMDAAIAAHEESGFDGYTKVDEIPFDFVRKRMSVVVEKNKERILITKGAPESVLEVCKYMELNGQTLELSPERKKLARDRFTELSRDGYRALAVAYRPVGNNRTVYSVADESELIFVGYVTFIDPPKESAAKSVEELNNLGVKVKILTGDNELVSKRICERVGLEVHGVVMGQDIDSMDDEELISRVEGATICARLSPEQKNRIITVLKKAGHVVGYMGDGINDTLALRTADVGISVNNAVDVAKEAADIVLLEEGLRILENGIIEGRRTFANTMKYIMMGTSSNFGNMFSVPIASVLVPFLPMLPVQILLNNLLYDFSQVSIPTDRVDSDYVKQPRRWNIGFIRNFMIVFGPISSLYDIMTYLVMLYVFHARPSLFQTGWFVESLATQTLVIHIIRSRYSIFKSRGSTALWVTTLAAVGIGMIIPYTPVGAYFYFSPLPPPFFLVLGGMVGAYLLMVEGVKRWFYRRFGW
ncbi:MAG TPA: magnesium-translocating P-type ATPase [Firmicutes bacterium]|nr:magnesium-translocating P-type ATPase [Bacillota bacterium]